MKKKMLLLGILALIVSCGGGGTSGESTSNVSTPILPEVSISTSPEILPEIKAVIETKADLEKLPFAFPSSERLKVPQKPLLENEDQEVKFLSPVRLETGSVNKIVKNKEWVKYPLTINLSTQVTIEKGGIAFYLEKKNFNSNTPLKEQVKNYLTEASLSDLSNLTVNMEKDSILFMSNGGEIKTSQIEKGTLFSAYSSTKKPNINGDNYKEILLFNGKLIIDKDSNLEDPNDSYNLIKLNRTDILVETGINISGVSENMIAIGQKEDGLSSGNNIERKSSGNSLINKGNINLEGKNSIGIYNSGVYIKETQNKGKITVGNESTGIYILDKDDYSNENKSRDRKENSNDGEIIIGDKSVGVYQEYYYEPTGRTFENNGNINSISENVTGIFMNVGTKGEYYIDTLKRDNSEKILDNKGKIELIGDKSVGIYATGQRNYSVYNTGEIVIGDSSDKKNPSVGIFTDSKELSLINNGIISVGKDSVGMMGFKRTSANKFFDKSVKTIENNNKIELLKNGAIGIYIDEDAIGLNNGEIKSTSNVEGTIGAVVMNNSEFLNIKDINNNSDGGIGLLSMSGILTNSGIITAGKSGIGIYATKSSKVENSGTIRISGDNAIGMLLGNNTEGISSGIIETVGSPKKVVGIAVGSNSKFLNEKDINNNSDGGIGLLSMNGSLTNRGTVTAGKNGIGIYATKSSKVENSGTIRISGDNAIGMLLGDNTEGINSGIIETVGSPKKVIGIVVGKNAEFTNNGKIHINSPEGAGIVVAGGVIKNYGEILVTGGAEREKIDKNFTENIPNINVDINTENFSRELGIYVDTLGKTNPIKGMEKLKLEKVNLLIGAEAASKTNETVIEVSEEILKPYNDSIKLSETENYEVSSGALTWDVEAETENGEVKKAVLKKKSYTVFAENEKSEKVAAGLDDRYSANDLDSEEKQLFNYLNTLGNNDRNILEKTFKEVSGSQYINVQQRIKKTGEMIDKEISELQKESMITGSRIKTFVTSGKYNTEINEIADYANKGYGIAYVNNSVEKNTGWYAGVGMNNFKLKDNGKSEEEIGMFKLGAYRTFGLGNYIDWTLSGEGFVSRSETDRKYVVGNTLYTASSGYNSYGVAFKNELGKNFNIGENIVLRPYGNIKIEYGRFSDIKEKNGILRLEVEGNDYYSINPEVGIALDLSREIFSQSRLKLSLLVGYEYELGKIDNMVNKARLAYTNSSWFELKGSEEEERGNFKTDLKLGFESGNYGITLNGGYDTNGKNLRGGIGFNASF